MKASQVRCGGVAQRVSFGTIRGAAKNAALRVSKVGRRMELSKKASSDNGKLRSDPKPRLEHAYVNGRVLRKQNKLSLDQVPQGPIALPVVHKNLKVNREYNAGFFDGTENSWGAPLLAAFREGALPNCRHLTPWYL